MRANLIAFLLLFLTTAFAESTAPQGALANTPIGRWQTVDDVTGKPKSIVTIWEDSGKLYGKIEEILNPDPDNPQHICKHCEGDLKDKPEIGLRILWDMQKNGDQWSGGKILDPHNGKIYRCSLALEEGGKKLKVRGFIGISLLGRTQYWSRQE